MPHPPQQFLHPALDHLLDPYALHGMAAAVARIQQAIAATRADPHLRRLRRRRHHRHRPAQDRDRNPRRHRPLPHPASPARRLRHAGRGAHARRCRRRAPRHQRGHRHPRLCRRRRSRAAQPGSHRHRPPPARGRDGPAEGARRSSIPTSPTAPIPASISAARAWHSSWRRRCSKQSTRSAPAKSCCRHSSRCW